MSELYSTIFTGIASGFVDSLNFAAFLSYCLRSRPLLDLAFFAFLMNGFVLATFFGAEWISGSDSVLSFATQVAWQVPMKLLVDVFGVGGWTLYHRMYAAAWAEAKKRQTGNLGAPPEKVRHRVSVGEKINRSATLVVASLIKPLLLLWLSYVPTVVPMPLLQLIFPAAPIQRAVVLILIALTELVACVVDCLAYSFFCFEARLSTIVVDQRVIPLSNQLKWFEYQWPYFVGYGLLQFVANKALVATGKPLYAAALFSTMMPVNVVTSLGAISDPGPTCPFRIPLFSATPQLLSWPLQKLVQRRQLLTASAEEEVVVVGE